LWQYKVYADIRVGSLEMERQTTVWWSTVVIVSAIGRYIFGNFIDIGQHYYTVV